MIVTRLFLPFAMSAAFSFTAALAAKDFDKPLVVMMFDKNCHAWCDQVRPVMKELKDKYGDKVDFDELDTTQAVIHENKAKANQLGIGKYYEDAPDNVPEVEFFDSKRHLAKELVGPKKKEDYLKALDKVLGKT